MYKQGDNKNQLTLSPMCLDDYIGEDSVCRVIAAYVGRLDMAALGFKYGETKDTGRPSYNPADMLSLYIYGYMNRVRSSRRLERETHRNVEVMWLLNKLTPDDKTICNFRKDNSAALKRAFREFSLLCNKLNLYGKELIAVDGTKNRASANRHSIHTKKGTEKELASVEKKIAEYMNELAANDESEKSEAKLNEAAVAAALKRLNDKKDTLNDWLKQIEANDGKEISTVDPDAHMMHSNGDARNLDACYNVQTVADAKHKLILDFDVSTSPDDSGALYKMTEAAKEIMGVSEINVTADKGYYDGKDVVDCEQSGTTCFVPKTADHHHAPDTGYDHKHFRYDKENDCYFCLEGTALHCVKSRKNGLREYTNSRACKNCPNREKCTVSQFRTITRAANQDVLDVMNARMKTDEGKAVFRERKKIIEHPFGTTKAVWGFKQYLCRSKERVVGEQSLTFLAYNLRRVINIFTQNQVDLAAAMA